MPRHEGAGLSGSLPILSRLVRTADANDFVRKMASTGAIRKYLAEHPKDFDPRKYLAVATKAMKGIYKARYEAFGIAGNASKIKALSLEAMTARYAKGELDPKVN